MHWLIGWIPSKCKQFQLIKKTKQKKLHLQISTVIGIYGPHLMIVIIFLTQNSFQNGPGISDRLLGFYRTVHCVRYLVFNTSPTSTLSVTKTIIPLCEPTGSRITKKAATWTTSATRRVQTRTGSIRQFHYDVAGVQTGHKGITSIK